MGSITSFTDNCSAAHHGSCTTIIHSQTSGPNEALAMHVDIGLVANSVLRLERLRAGGLRRQASHPHLRCKLSLLAHNLFML